MYCINIDPRLKTVLDSFSSFEVVVIYPNTVLVYNSVCVKLTQNRRVPCLRLKNAGLGQILKPPHRFHLWQDARTEKNQAGPFCAL